MKIHNEVGHPGSQMGISKGDGALFGPIGTRTFSFSRPQYYSQLVI
jgi:hypothetical protein